VASEADGRSPRVGEEHGVRVLTTHDDRAFGEEPADDSPLAVDAVPPGRKTTGRWLYADKPLERRDPEARDALRLGAYAAALALLMDQKSTDTPLTLAISGPWGSGKSSLAEMVKYRLRFGSDWNASHVVCEFDAWAHDDAPSLGTAFAAAVAKSVNSARYPWTRLWSPLPSGMLSPIEKWRRRLWLGLFTIFVALAVILWPSGGSLLSAVLHPSAKIAALGHGANAARLSIPVILAVVIAAVRQLSPGVQAVANWVDSPGSQAALGTMRNVNEELGRLIRQALRGRRRLMIFVDNLERCKPPRAVEVCEVVSQLIGHKDVVTVLIGDMDTIALSAEIKYKAFEKAAPDDARKDPPGTFGRAYLEKLIQFQVKLPQPTPESLREMFIPAGDERPAFPEDGKGYAPPSLMAKVRSGFAPSPFLSVLGIAAITVITQAIVAFAVSLGVSLGSAAAFILAVVAIIIIVVAAVVYAFVASTVLAGVAVVVGVAIAMVWVIRAGERAEAVRRTERRRTIDEIIDKLIHELASKNGDPARGSEVGRPTVSQEQIERLAWEISGRYLDFGWPDLQEVDRRLKQGIIDEILRPELDRALLADLPRSPRAAKRMVNHVHLLLAIAVERGVIGAEVSVRQLAEWARFTDGWPAEAATVADVPKLMAVFEQVARSSPLDPSYDSSLRVLGDAGFKNPDPTLLDYLRRISPLAEVAEALVNFAPP
jgi:KAP family P-loop domain